MSGRAITAIYQNLPDHAYPNIADLAGNALSPMTDVYLAMMKASAIISAGQLGLFAALAHGPRTAEALAQALHASREGISRLADFLVSLGYLDLSGDRYGNAPATARWFTEHGDVDFTPGLLWTAEAWGLMSNLSAAVKAGGPEQTLWERMGERPALGSAFSNYMSTFAEYIGPDLLASASFSAPPKRMLDLGGSHGLHSISFCRRYPELASVIVDLPSALTGTDTAIADAGMRNRISLRPGDIQNGGWGSGYDLVLYLSVAHNQSPDGNQRVLASIFDAMRPGGLLIIHEHPADRTRQQFDAAFRLTLLVETATRTYEIAEISDWLRNAGFGIPTVIELDPRDKGVFLIVQR